VSFRVLVCGGRDYTDGIRIYAALGALRAERGLSYIIHGGARGADSFAGDWAHGFLIPVREFLPDYNRYSPKLAPLMRNQLMLDEGKPDLVVAFPGGSGTADLVRRARKAGVEVMVMER